MKLFLLLKYLIILAKIVIISDSQCSNQENDYFHSYDSCVFYYSNCAQFSLQHCTWSECTDTDDSSCGGPKDKSSNNQITCTNHCCDPNVNYLENKISFNQCQYYIKKGYTESVGANVGIGLGSCTFIVVFSYEKKTIERMLQKKIRIILTIELNTY